jgi:hypothetical protein
VFGRIVSHCWDWDWDACNTIARGELCLVLPLSRVHISLLGPHGVA